MMTFEEIEKLSLHEPIVHKLLTMYKMGQITKEEALIGMVFGLKGQKDYYYNEVVKLVQNRPAPLIEEMEGK